MKRILACSVAILALVAMVAAPVPASAIVVDEAPAMGLHATVDVAQLDNIDTVTTVDEAVLRLDTEAPATVAHAATSTFTVGLTEDKEVQAISASTKPASLDDGYKDSTRTCDDNSGSVYVAYTNRATQLMLMV